MVRSDSVYPAVRRFVKRGFTDVAFIAARIGVTNTTVRKWLRVMRLDGVKIPISVGGRPSKRGSISNRTIR